MGAPPPKRGPGKQPTREGHRGRATEGEPQRESHRGRATEGEPQRESHRGRAAEGEPPRESHRGRATEGEQQGSRAAGQQGSRAAGQQSSRAAEQQSSRAAEQQSSRAAEQQSSRAAEQQSHRGPKEAGSHFCILFHFLHKADVAWWRRVWWLSGYHSVAVWLCGLADKRLSGRYINSAKFGTNQRAKAANPTNSAAQFYAKNRILCKKPKSQKAHTTALFSEVFNFIAKIRYCIKPKNIPKIFH